MMSRRKQYIIIWTVDLITVRALVSPHMALATGLHRLSLLPPSHNSTLGAPDSLNLGPSLIMDFFFLSVGAHQQQLYVGALCHFLSLFAF